MNSPHMAMVAEDGAEAIIPLSSDKRQRGLDLWLSAGKMLGVSQYADGGIVGDTNGMNTATSVSAGGSVDIKIELNPEFVIEAQNAGDEDRMIAVIKAHIREMVDDISDELADRLARVFSNMPVKGVV